MEATKSLVNWPTASAFAGPQASPGFRFWRDFMAWQRGLNEALRPHDLTQPQFALLATISWLTRDVEEAAGLPVLSQQTLADFLGLERMLVSQVVSRLDAAGLVSRNPVEEDRRTKCLSVTSHGARKLITVLPVVEAYDQAFFVATAEGPPAGQCSELPGKAMLAGAPFIA